MWQVIFFQRKNIILSIETRDRVLFSSQTQVSTGVLERCMLPKEEVTWNRIDWFCSINVLNLMYLSLNLLFQYSQIISKRKKKSCYMSLSNSPSPLSLPLISEPLLEHIVVATIHVSLFLWNPSELHQYWYLITTGSNPRQIYLLFAHIPLLVPHNINNML